MAYLTSLEAIELAEELNLTIPDDPVVLEKLLRRASKTIDLLYGNRFIGSRINQYQTLYWPRITGTYDQDGNARADFNTDVIPTEIKLSTIELSAKLYDDFNPFKQPLPAITEESKEMDVLKKSVKYAEPYSNNEFYFLDLLLRPLLKTKNRNSITMSRGA